MKMKKNITNRPDLEEARQANFIEEHAHQPEPEAPTPDAGVDESPFPLSKGMREKIETVEVSTFKPKA